jgi:hypothetical protein
MPISPATIKKLFARSNNQCAMFGCKAPLVVGDHVIAEICHIRARRKNGPRFDPTLTVAEKDDFKNLILLCPTDHTLVDKDEETYSPQLLLDMKAGHEQGMFGDLTPATIRQAQLILDQHNSLGSKCSIKGSSVSGSVSANAGERGAAIAIGGHNQGNININIHNGSKGKGRGYPSNSIGGDANLSGYVDYLVGLYVKYMSSLEDEGTSNGKLGKHLKSKFRIGPTRTRYHIPAEKFEKVVEYLIDEKLANTPVGKMHRRRGTRICSSFEEWRTEEKT